MSAKRNWYLSTVAIAALLFGLDAVAEKPSFGVPKFPDKKSAWAGPGKGPSPSLDRGNPAARGTQFERGAPTSRDPSGQDGGDSSDSSTAKGSPGRDGDKAEKSNRDAAHGRGKDKNDTPDENVQANAGDVIPQGKPLHKISTCQ
jgi:hypothetical protein